MVQSIFDGGRLKAQDDLALAQQMQLIATYRKTVFTAFSDVETSLGQASADTDQLVALTEEVRASAEAFRIAELQYREGTIDILSLLHHSADPVHRRRHAGADQAGAAASRCQRLSFAGRRLDAGRGGCRLPAPARLVASVVSRHGRPWFIASAYERPYNFEKRRLYGPPFSFGADRRCGQRSNMELLRPCGC